MEILRKKLEARQKMVNKALGILEKYECPRGLMVEDDAFDAYAVQRVLEQIVIEMGLEDHSLEFATTVSEFKDNIEENNLAYLVVDMRLPEGSGLETAYEAWQQGKIECPIFFVSGKEPRDSEKLLIEEMKAQFFKKPLTLNDCKKILETIAIQERKVQ